MLISYIIGLGTGIFVSFIVYMIIRHRNIKKKLDKISDKFGVTKTEYKAKDIPGIIKKLEKRLKTIDKEEKAADDEVREEKKSIAATDLTREAQLRLLNIVKENGISLREGAMGVKTYYEIAKTAYLEGLAKGLEL